MADGRLHAGRVGVLFVCYGNICRSPMAEFVFRKILDEQGLSDRFEVSSAGTSPEHIGEPTDSRAAETLKKHGISCEGKTSRRLLRSDFVDYDYVVGMDGCNMEYISFLCPEGACETGMLGDYSGTGEVDDPYYTRDFERAYREIREGCLALLNHIKEGHPELA